MNNGIVLSLGKNRPKSFVTMAVIMTVIFSAFSSSPTQASDPTKLEFKLVDPAQLTERGRSVSASASASASPSDLAARKKKKKKKKKGGNSEIGDEVSKSSQSVPVKLPGSSSSSSSSSSLTPSKSAKESAPLKSAKEAQGKAQYYSTPAGNHDSGSDNNSESDDEMSEIPWVWAKLDFEDSLRMRQLNMDGLRKGLIESKKDFEKGLEPETKKKDIAPKGKKNDPSSKGKQPSLSSKEKPSDLPLTYLEKVADKLKNLVGRIDGCTENMMSLMDKEEFHFYPRLFKNIGQLENKFLLDGYLLGFSYLNTGTDPDPEHNGPNKRKRKLLDPIDQALWIAPPNPGFQPVGSNPNCWNCFDWNVLVKNTQVLLPKHLHLTLENLEMSGEVLKNRAALKTAGHSEALLNYIEFIKLEEKKQLEEGEKQGSLVGADEEKETGDGEEDEVLSSDDEREDEDEEKEEASSGAQQKPKLLQSSSSHSRQGSATLSSSVQSTVATSQAQPADETTADAFILKLKGLQANRTPRDMAAIKKPPTTFEPALTDQNRIDLVEQLGLLRQAEQKESESKDQADDQKSAGTQADSTATVRKKKAWKPSDFWKFRLAMPPDVLEQLEPKLFLKYLGDLTRLWGSDRHIVRGWLPALNAQIPKMNAVELVQLTDIFYSLRFRPSTALQKKFAEAILPQLKYLGPSRLAVLAKSMAVARWGEGSGAQEPQNRLKIALAKVALNKINRANVSGIARMLWALSQMDVTSANAPSFRNAFLNYSAASISYLNGQEIAVPKRPCLHQLYIAQQYLKIISKNKALVIEPGSSLGQALAGLPFKKIEGKTSTLEEEFANKYLKPLLKGKQLDDLTNGAQLWLPEIASTADFSFKTALNAVIAILVDGESHLVWEEDDKETYRGNDFLLREICRRSNVEVVEIPYDLMDKPDEINKRFLGAPKLKKYLKIKNSVSTN